MSTQPSSLEPSAPPETPVAAPASLPSNRWSLLPGGLAVLALAVGVTAWQKLNTIQEQLARQSADSTAQASEANVVARRAQELAIETAAKLAVNEAKLAEVALQRTQLEELMQSLSRSRDENMVVDIESAIRLALQQSQLTGSIDPLLAALNSAQVRLARAAQPRLAPVQRALVRDLERIKATTMADTPTLLVKLDELVSLADDLPLGNAAPAARSAEPIARKSDESMTNWWGRLAHIAADEVRALVRVSSIADPDAAMLSPEQAFFVRENLKLRLLNARLGLLSRQTDSARSDLATAEVTLARYFQGGSRKTQAASALLQQTQNQMKALQLPRVDDTLTALATAAAGR